MGRLKSFEKTFLLHIFITLLGVKIKKQVLFLFNYSIVKKELLDTYNNKFELKEDILYFMNDFCPFIYGVSKISYKRMRRILAFIIKEKKYISLLSLLINNDNHNSNQTK